MKLIITDLENTNFNISGEYKIIRPDENIKRCIGCFGCWVKTPGKCVLPGDLQNMGIYMSRSDEIILISKCVYGSVSPFVKAVQDRGISYVTGDFVDVDGEMHHKARYNKTLAYSAYIYGDDITEDEKETLRGIIRGNAVNFYGTVKGVHFFNSEKELEGIEI